MTTIAALFADNPVLLKDASLLGRRKRMVLAWVAATLGLFAAAAIAYADGADDVRTWGSLTTPGPAMLFAVGGLVSVVVSVLITSMAATSITSERERGTLPLLLVSGLSPARIIAGKFGGLVIVAVPFLAAAFPLLALSSFFLGVDVDSVALTVVALMVHAAAVAAAGLWASAHVGRVRSALMLSFIAAAAPTMLAALTVGGSLAMALDEHKERASVLGGVGIVVEGIFAAAFLLGAWSQLAPKLAPRWRSARWLLRALIVLVPALAAGAMFIVDINDLRAMLLVLTTFVLGLTCLIAPALTGKSDTPTPARMGLSVWAVSMVALACLVGCMAVLRDYEPHLSDDDISEIVAFVAFCFAGCGVVSMGARHLKNPLAPIALTLVGFATTSLLPAIFDPFTVGAPPFAFMSLPYVLDRNDVNGVACAAFYGVIGVIAFVAARGKRVS